MISLLNQKTGWIVVDVTAKNENFAKAIRAERDSKYGNIYEEIESDERWVGDLGEMVFNKWFEHQKVEGYQWILDGTAGAPDFITSLNIRIGVKTVKRAAAPRMDYTAQITAQHANEPIEQFFFMTYEINNKKMWLLGGLDKETFLKEAVYYKAGDKVHANYTVREGHEIFNIQISKLVTPSEWLKLVTQ